MGTTGRCAICAWVLFGHVSLSHAQFVTVINAPPTVIGNAQSIGSSTQLNVFDGGAVGRDFGAGAADGSSTNVELNVKGGTVGTGLNAYGGSTVNVSGGTVRNGFTAHSRSEVNVSGGEVLLSFEAANDSIVNITGGSVGSGVRALTGSEINILGGAIGNDFFAETGSAVKLVGAEFRLDGTLISGLDTVGTTQPFDLPRGSVLSGTLADGTPFAFWDFSPFISQGFSVFSNGTLTLEKADVPAATPELIVVPIDSAPLGLREGQKLVVAPGGMIADSFNAGRESTVEIVGGEVGHFMEAVGAHVILSDGVIGQEFKALDGSIVDIAGGSVGTGFHATNGSVVNISGGSVSNMFRADKNSTVNIAAGSVRTVLASSSEVTVLGGDVGGIIGSEGSAVHVSNGSIERVRVGAGGIANISGGVIEDFMSGELGVSDEGVAVVNITGGTIGTIGSRWNAYKSRILISGGVVGDNLWAWNDTVVNISGGEIGNQFRAQGGSEVNISGGVIGNQFVINSVVNISGGTFGNLLVDRFGKVHLFGKQFVLDGVDITNTLLAGDPLAITQRDVTLSGLLADGSPFSIELNTSIDNTRDVFVAGSLLTVTLVPEPSCLVLTIGFLLVSRRR